ncbi:MFS transporter [Neisseriaceae bacterium B1]
MKPLQSFALSLRFSPLFGTQFLGAFNDNLFKTSLFVMISFYGLGQNSVLPPSQMLNLGALLFVLPYFLFSAFAGQLATRFNKARLAQMTKVLEVCTMSLAAYGFYLQSAPLLLFCLFVMGAQSTLFGPVKYAILPEYLDDKELVMGNGLIESGTFLAILLGQILGTMVAGSSPLALTIWVVGTAILGLLASVFMPSVAAKDSSLKIDANFARSTKVLMRDIFKQKELLTAIFGISWFWFIGSVYTTQLPTFVQKHLGGNDNVFNLMLALFSIGIACGSVFCARISKGALRLGLVAVGGVGLTLCGGLLVVFANSLHFSGGQLEGIFSFLSHGFAYLIILTMLGIGFFGGFFSVPLYTWLQTASSDEFRAQAIAANNIVNAVFMVSAALISAVLLFVFDSILLLYLVVALGNIPMIIYLAMRSPKVLADFRKQDKSV